MKKRWEWYKVVARNSKVKDTSERHMRSWVIGLKWVSMAQSMKLWIGFVCDVWRTHGNQCQEYVFLGRNAVWFDTKSTNYRQCCYIPDNSILDSFGWQYGLVVGSSKDIKAGILHERRRILQPGCSTTSFWARPLFQEVHYIQPVRNVPILCHEFCCLKPFIAPNTRYSNCEIFYTISCKYSLYHCDPRNCVA